MTASTRTGLAAAVATRRQVLAVGASVAGAAVLAACSTGGDGGTPGGSAATSGAGASGTPAPGGGLVALADVPVGGSVAVTTAAGDPLLVAQPKEGTVVAFSAICTHQGCLVRPDGAKLRCPCHGSVYDAFTGDNLEGPAPRPLDEVTVEVQDGEVVEA